jgi:nucleotide-binding universal stress UspA family protein
MKLFERVLVAVGEGEPGLDLIRYARQVATVLCDASFRFIHVLGWATGSRFGDAPVTHAAALSRLQRDVHAHFGDSGGECAVVHGVVVDGVLDEAMEWGADLVLVGHARPESGRRLLARRLAIHSPCSVWMKPLHARVAIRRVLAAIDYSDSSAYALSAAAHLTRRAGGIHCRALHVFPERERDGGYRRTAREEFDRFVAPLDTAAVEIEPLLVEGDSVASALQFITTSGSADLVVMGSRGRSRSANILLGSEAEQILMESPIPVLIGRRAEAAAGFGHGWEAGAQRAGLR